MAARTNPGGQTASERDASRYPFSGHLSILTILLLIAMLLFLAGLVVVYVGDEVAVPSWNEESVPAVSLQ